MDSTKANAGAVIIADLVDSTHFPSGEVERRLASLLNGLEREIDWLLVPEIYRGDSFQGVLKGPDDMLYAAVLARALLKQEGANWDLRVAVGIGGIDRLTDRPGTSDGEAFRLSGQLADVMKSDRARIALALPLPTEPVSAVLTLLEAVIEKWTSSQAEVIVKLMKGKAMKEIAGELKISQSAVSQHAQAAKWWAIEPLIRTFSQLIKAYYPYD